MDLGVALLRVLVQRYLREWPIGHVYGHYESLQPTGRSAEGLVDAVVV